MVAVLESFHAISTQWLSRHILDQLPGRVIVTTPQVPMVARTKFGDSWKMAITAIYHPEDCCLAFATETWVTQLSAASIYPALEAGYFSHPCTADMWKACLSLRMPTTQAQALHVACAIDKFMFPGELGCEGMMELISKLRI